MLLEKQQMAIVVIGLIKNEKGEILLQKRLDPLIPAAHEKWEFPGGRIDFGESPEEALIRETREEVGCGIRIQQLLPLVQSPV
ncbi:MAG: NUDIX domain-containing protein, partial [Patescibacteria group bacterium]